MTERGGLRMKEIKQIVARISGHRNRECYTILCYAVEAARHYQPQEPKMKVILADVVDMMEEKKELSTLSKALSRVAADIWEHGDHQELWKVFGRQTVDPPTPKELVFRLAEYVWREFGDTGTADCLPAVAECSGGWLRHYRQNSRA